jgi:prepilin-type N-terminal cleavage/methylation domain-containing protein
MGRDMFLRLTPLDKRKGLTLLELLVAIVIMVVITAAAFALYISAFKRYKEEARSAESFLSAEVALEIIRRDIEHAGCGLPWDLGNITYNEAQNTTFNDAPSNPPRALIAQRNEEGGDYLVIKSVRAKDNEATRKWMIYDAESQNLTYLGEEGSNFNSDECYIMLEVSSKSLKLSKVGSNWYGCGSFNPTYLSLPGALYLIFGVLDNANNATQVRMPFNRVDYFLKKPLNNFPEKCAAGTFILYRAELNHKDGRFTEQPLLDCVKEFKVVTKRVNQWNDGSWTLSSSAETIRKELKGVRVFILVQEGQKLDHPASPERIDLGDSETGIIKTVNLTSDERYYRWRVLKVIARPYLLGGY